LIPYDETFLIHTLSSPPNGTAKVIPSRGVKIRHLYYWCNAFRDPQVEKAQVEVRYDPMNAGIAYAYVGRRWTQCISEHYARFNGRSHREVQLASEELRRQLTVHGQRFGLSSRKLAAFLASVDIPQPVSTVRLHDAELKQALQITGDQRGAGAQADAKPDDPREGTDVAVDASPRATIDNQETDERRLYKEFQ